MKNIFEALDSVTGEDEAMIKTLDGDVQIGVYQADVGFYQLVAVTDEGAGPFCILEEFFTSVKDALNGLHEFLKAEYEVID